MPRPIKEGLEYFPVDIDIFDDPKLLFVSEKFGEMGELVAVKLLSWIYRNGYFIEWNDDMAVIFSSRAFRTIKSDFVKDVVNELIEREFFNKEKFFDCGILTSRGIQKRWQFIITNSKRKAKINSSFALINSEETSANTEETPPIPEEMQQSKVKESKVNKRKEKESKKEETPSSFFVKNLFLKNTKIRDPSHSAQIQPVLKFLSEIPQAMTKEEIENCIIEAFEELPKDKGVRIDFLCNNIQRKITAKHEEILGKIKQKELKEAEIERKKVAAIDFEHERSIELERLKNYKIFFEKNSDRFSVYEKQLLLKLFEENKIIEAGRIIEPKMETAELI